MADVKLTAARRVQRSTTEKQLKRAIVQAAVDYIERTPGATYATLEATVTVWREWVRRRRPVHF
jgi:hypothetical protein